MNIPILYQDQDLTVIEKPSGLVVNRSSTVKEETLQDWFASELQTFQKKEQSDWKLLVPADFQAEFGSPEEIFAERGGIVHRLDKETSGVMVLANNPGALVELLRQFRVRETTKMYTCLTHGKFQITEDTLRLPLGRSLENRTKFTIDASGRVAETEYRVTQFYPVLNGEQLVQDISHQSELSDQKIEKNLRKKLQHAYQGFSLLQCWPKTGRTHQIRVHMSAIKHPIVADETYLGRRRLGLDRYWCPRLFLHATELEITHPRTKERMKFVSKLSPELELVIQKYLQ